MTIYESDHIEPSGKTYLDGRIEAAGWNPVETMPKSGQFLIGVWEGEWREPRQVFHVYEATGFLGGPVWGRSYRTAEGEAYEVVGWMEKPLPPKD